MYTSTTCREKITLQRTPWNNIACRISPCLENEDEGCENPVSIAHLQSLSEKDIGEDIWRKFKELKESME